MTRSHMPLHTPTITRFFALGTCAVLLCACETRTERLGEQKELVFSYQAADRKRDFSRPLARGSSLLLRVEGNNEQPANRIVSHTTSAPDVLGLALVQNSRDELLVTANIPGTSRIEVEALLDGENQPRRDFVELRVAEAKNANVAHICTGAREAAYLRGEPIEVDFARYDSRGDKLVGNGACGVSLSPGDGVSGTNCDEASLIISNISSPGTVTLDSGLPPTRGEAGRVDLQIVDPRLLDFDPISGSLDEFSTDTFTLEAYTPNWPVCTKLEFDVDILTPYTCEESGSGATRFSVGREAANTIDLRGNSSGECVFQVSLPKYGITDVWEFSIPVYADYDD